MFNSWKDYIKIKFIQVFLDLIRLYIRSHTFCERIYFYSALVFFSTKKEGIQCNERMVEIVRNKIIFDEHLRRNALPFIQYNKKDLVYMLHMLQKFFLLALWPTTHTQRMNALCGWMCIFLSLRFQVKSSIHIQPKFLNSRNLLSSR